MAVILVYVAFVLIGQALAFLISAAIETVLPAASLLVFFGLFALVFVVAWFAAVYVSERFLGRFLNYGPDQPPPARTR